MRCCRSPNYTRSVETDLLDFGIGLVETDTKVSMDIGRRMAHPRGMEDCQERTAMENERSRVVEAMPGFV